MADMTYAAGAMTLADAGEALGVSPSTLRVQIKRGRLAAIKIGKTWVVSPEELARYGGDHLRKPAPARRRPVESDRSLAAALIRSSAKLGEAAELAITGNRQRALDAAKAELARLRRLPKR